MGKTESKNDKINNKIMSKRIQADIKSVKTAYINGYNTVFARDIQVLITTLGLLIAEAYGHELKPSTFLGSIDYLCLKILKNKEIHKFMKDLEINDQGNNSKHTLKEVIVNNDECIHQYNHLVDELIAKTTFDSLKKMKIYKTQKKENNLNIFKEFKSVRYELVGKNNMTFKLSPYYSFDKYAKKAKIDLTIIWEKESDEFVELTITNTKTGKKKNVNPFDLDDKLKKTIEIQCKEDDLSSDNVISIDLYMELHRTIEVKKTKIVKERHPYETGHLFWKKTEYYTTDKEVEYKEEQDKITAKKTINLSQKLREEKK